MASPPYNIAETTPQASDFQSVYPAAEQSFRDVVESWLTGISDPATGLLRITLVDSSATVGPVFPIFRDSASPAASDNLGQIVFQGRDSAANLTNYTSIYTQIVSPTNGSEIANIHFQTTENGALVETAVIGYTGSVADKGLFLTSIAPGAQGVSPTIRLYRNISPYGGAMGAIYFDAQNNNGSRTAYGGIYSQVTNGTVGGETGYLTMYTLRNGSANITYVQIQPGNVTIGGGTLTVTG
jgi:hypothetical protein